MYPLCISDIYVIKNFDNIFKLRTEADTPSVDVLTDSLTDDHLSSLLLKTWQKSKKHTLAYKVSGSKSPGQRYLEVATTRIIYT